MRRILMVLGLVIGSLAIAPNAFAACVGTQNTMVICTGPGEPYEDCVYTGVKPGCTPVTVPGIPRVYCQSGCS